MKISRLFAISIVLSCVFPTTAQDQGYGGTVIDQRTGNPVGGVLVSLGHSEFHTRTDVNGNFALSTTSVGSARLSSKTKSLRARWNFRNRTIDFRSAPDVNSVSIYTVNGKRVFNGQLPPSMVIELPSPAKGIYLLDIQGKQGLRGKARVILSNRTTSSFTFHTTTLSGGAPRLTKPAQTSSSPERLIFRHDDYYPKDVNADGPNNNMSVSLRPDERSFVFDQSKIREYRFTISPADSATLDTDGWKEEFVRAAMTFEGTPYGDIGLRYKGSEYTLPRCFGLGSTGDLGSTGKTCPKISYKVKFTEYDAAKRFYGMKKINLHALTGDGTKVHDMLAYELYRDMGIHAPRTSYANVYVNNRLAGLFLAVEEIDGRFTKSRWPDYGDGNLYKEVWPASASENHYKNGLKTNDDPEDNPDVRKMIAYYNAIAASNEQTFAQNLSPYMDFDHFLRYMAVDVAVHNWDGIRSWYSDQTARQWSSNHNYYFYEEENAGGKIWLVPWDMDNTFWEIDPYFETAKVPQWNETPEHCGGHPTWNGEYIRPPNCDKLTKLMASVFWNRFVKLGEQFLRDLFASQRLIDRINTHRQVISESVQRDPNISNSSWTNDVNTLILYLPDLVTKFSNHIHSIKTDLNANRYLSPVQPNNYEFTLASDNMHWVQKYFSENSGGSVTHNRVNPLSGAADMRFDFSFRETNNPNAWDVWGNFQPEFEQPANLSNLKEIRVTLRGDTARNWRLSLGNWDVYQEHGASSDYGWELSVTAQKQTVTLKMSEIAYPGWAAVKPDIKAEVLKTVRTLIFSPGVRCTDAGFLATAPAPDTGSLQADDIEFVY
ncbi:MAG: CotH kinase family protein [Chitinispirillales bacterium]|jgi:hypothetical protein|nr:CotH kinase family protein [Chitinispirillales bacterium]